MAGSLLLGATGCGEDGDDDGLPKNYKVVAGAQLCGGKAISADASKALTVITGSSRFEASADEYTVAQAATDLADAFPGPTTTEDICRVFMPIDTPDFDLRITWNLEDGPPTGPSASKFTELKMGELSVAAADEAIVFFACQSPKFYNPKSSAHIVIDVQHWATHTEPDDNVEALKDAYATVAHSVSLAMAKELRCEKNGGLPAKPVLDPA
ncbi:hypothetical protein [Streptomyces europaeiscabiei]|uniref:hypothetical protein n=1 Tax=Streptomyces europaeiscabiei TaxID=146819 RepID=UPI0029B19E77|nr:hypothetical protein [Streptomyces europaeiscabiei]MDX3584887.1 hypothetical protein [Streptomyces europaeiscabiei]